MYIAMIGQKGYPAAMGGVERHVQDLSRRLVLAGHEVTVYSREWYTKLEGTNVIDGIRVEHLPSIKTKHLDAISHTLLATMRAMKSDADVLHYHGVGPALLSWIPRVFAPNKKVVVTFHCIDRKHAKWRLIARMALRAGEWASCRFAHSLISSSPTIFQYVRDVYDKKSAYVPTGIDESDRVQSSGMLKEFNLTAGDYAICVSRLIPHKGIHTLISAWQSLRAAQPETIGTSRLVIVGGGHYTDRYVRQLKASALPKDRILFTGEQTGEALRELLSNASFFVHPSENEGLPIAVLEAMSIGLPVLASDILEHRDLIQNADMRFAPDDTPSLTNALARCLLLNKDELKKHGDRNRDFVIKHFSWKKILPQMLACYAEKDAKTVFTLQTTSAFNLKSKI